MSYFKGYGDGMKDMAVMIEGYNAGVKHKEMIDKVVETILTDPVYLKGYHSGALKTFEVLDFILPSSDDMTPEAYENMWNDIDKKILDKTGRI